MRHRLGLRFAAGWLCRAVAALVIAEAAFALLVQSLGGIEAIDFALAVASAWTWHWTRSYERQAGELLVRAVRPRALAYPPFLAPATGVVRIHNR